MCTVRPQTPFVQNQWLAIKWLIHQQKNQNLHMVEVADLIIFSWHHINHFIVKAVCEDTCAGTSAFHGIWVIRDGENGS